MPPPICASSRLNHHNLKRILLSVWDHVLASRVEAIASGLEAIACREVVLGSDIVHETWMGPAALEILMQCLMPGGRAVIVLPASHHRTWAGNGGKNPSFAFLQKN